MARRDLPGVHYRLGSTASIDAGVDVVGLLQFRDDLRTATGAAICRNDRLDRTMTWFGRDLLVDRHGYLAGGAHPLGGVYVRLNVGRRSPVGAEPRLGAESVAAFVGVRGDGGENDYCDDAE